MNKKTRIKILSAWGKVWKVRKVYEEKIQSENGPKRKAYLIGIARGLILSKDIEVETYIST